MPTGNMPNLNNVYSVFSCRMVLVLNGVLQEDCPPDTHSLYNSHPIYRETAAQLLAVPNKIIGPVGLLYIQQRELAATVPPRQYKTLAYSEQMTLPPASLSSSDILVKEKTYKGTKIDICELWGPITRKLEVADNFKLQIRVQEAKIRSGAVAMAHLDGSGTDEAVCTMVHRVQELALGYPEGRIELQLIGGFSDPRHYSDELFYNVITSHGSGFNACLRWGTEHYDKRGIHWPIIYGIGVNIKTGEIFPATFPDKGPDQALRCARYLTGVTQVLDIYDCNLGLLRIGPFNYEPLRGVDLWLEQNDDFILQHLSTCPEVEPPHFVMQVRATLKYIQDNQFPAVTVFRDNRPHYYRRDEHSGTWSPIRY
ncbi:hypothetical protein NQ317_002338 [Molorchus minor]|uniref:Uncharacterized protein n=1 Tax=Molorchus minor TaxID=1323400 RepID=A0ABQ9JUY2_9CUCU|nr:hypothetical protein NQ317_002338 [Molorchus minor]